MPPYLLVTQDYLNMPVEVLRLFGAMQVLSCRGFHFILYSLGLRLGEMLALKVKG